MCERAQVSRVPALNMQCDIYYPLQILADIMAIIEKADPELRQANGALAGSLKQEDRVGAIVRFQQADVRIRTGRQGGRLGPPSGDPGQPGGIRPRAESPHVGRLVRVSRSAKPSQSSGGVTAPARRSGPVRYPAWAAISYISWSCWGWFPTGGYVELRKGSAPGSRVWSCWHSRWAPPGFPSWPASRGRRRWSYAKWTRSRPSLRQGAGFLRILFHHILVNSMTPLILQLTVIFAALVLAESVLSFIRLGPPLPTLNWGNMIATGGNYVREAPRMSLFSGIAIGGAGLGLNPLADGLRTR